MQTKVTESKNTFSVSFKGLTKGELTALRNALSIGAFASPLAHELLASLSNAMTVDLGPRPVVTNLQCK